MQALLLQLRKFLGCFVTVTHAPKKTEVAGKHRSIAEMFAEHELAGQQFADAFVISKFRIPKFLKKWMKTKHGNP